MVMIDFAHHSGVGCELFTDGDIFNSGAHRND
jgi:hypothetical protein